MFKSTKEFDSAMKDILVQIRDGIAVNSLSSSIDEGDFNAALAECVDRRYLSGLSIPAHDGWQTTFFSD